MQLVKKNFTERHYPALRATAILLLVLFVVAANAADVAEEHQRQDDRVAGLGWCSACADTTSTAAGIASRTDVNLIDANHLVWIKSGTPILKGRCGSDNSGFETIYELGVVSLATCFSHAAELTSGRILLPESSQDYYPTSPSSVKTMPSPRFPTAQVAPTAPAAPIIAYPAPYSAYRQSSPVYCVEDDCFGTQTDEEKLCFLCAEWKKPQDGPMTLVSSLVHWRNETDGSGIPSCGKYPFVLDENGHPFVTTWSECRSYAEEINIRFQQHPPSPTLPPSPTFPPTSQPSSKYRAPKNSEDDYDDNDDNEFGGLSLNTFINLVVLFMWCGVCFACISEQRQRRVQATAALPNGGGNRRNQQELAAAEAAARRRPLVLAALISSQKKNESGPNNNDESGLELRNFSLSSNSQECSICLERIDTSSNNIVFGSSCSHVYHECCILEWLNSDTPNNGKCPNCRKPMWDPETYSLVEADIIRQSEA